MAIVLGAVQSITSRAEHKKDELSLEMTRRVEYRGNIGWH